MLFTNLLLIFLPHQKANLLPLLTMMLFPLTLSCGSLGKLDLCAEVKPDPLQLAGIVETGVKPVDIALSHPLHFLYNIILKSLCFGKTGQLQKSRQTFSEPTKSPGSRIVLKAEEHPTLVREKVNIPKPIWINGEKNK